MTSDEFIAHLLMRGFESLPLNLAESPTPNTAFHKVVPSPDRIFQEYFSVFIETSNPVGRDGETYHKMEIKITDSSGDIFERDFTHALEIIDTRLRVSQTYVNQKEEGYAKPHDEA